MESVSGVGVWVGSRYMRKRLVVAALAAAMVAVGANEAASAPRKVSVDLGVSAGTIVIKTAERRLYYVTGSRTALRYSIAVGRRGKQWQGLTAVARKYIKPAWSPPAEVRRDNPRLPDVIPGGAPNNPMGAAALTLARPEYAIHGTNRPSSIGTFASYGCFRMLNADILDLYDRVSFGTRVEVRP